MLDYIRAYFNDIPLLKSMVRVETSNGLALKNSVDIVITTSDYAASRPVLSHWRSSMRRRSGRLTARHLRTLRSMTP